MMRRSEIPLYLWNIQRWERKWHLVSATVNEFPEGNNVKRIPVFTRFWNTVCNRIHRFPCYFVSYWKFRFFFFGTIPNGTSDSDDRRMIWIVYSIKVTPSLSFFRCWHTSLWSKMQVLENLLWCKKFFFENQPLSLVDKRLKIWIENIKDYYCWFFSKRDPDFFYFWRVLDIENTMQLLKKSKRSFLFDADRKNFPKRFLV